jgi:hypothetical protein
MEFKDYRSGINEVFRYFWGGIFLYAAWKIFKVQVPAARQVEVSDFHLENPFILLIFVFSAGAFIYSLFRAMLLPVIDIVHMMVHRKSECILHFVEESINSSSLARTLGVYRNIRENEDYFSKELKTQIYLQRSEVHLLYIASFTLLVVLVVKLLNLFPDLVVIRANSPLLLFILFASCLLFLFGLNLDLDICHKERNHIRPKEETLLEYIQLYFKSEEEAQERAGKNLKKSFKRMIGRVAGK